MTTQADTLRSLDSNGEAVFKSKLGDEKLERVQMNDGLLRYETGPIMEEGEGCLVVSQEGTVYNGEVVYFTHATKSCEYGCTREGQHVHVSIS